MERIGLQCPQGAIATNWDEALGIADMVGFPAIIRPAFTLGGTGGGIAYNREEYEEIVRRGLERTGGNYRVMVELFNMPSDDYKRFLGVLRKYQCHMPFQQFRSAAGTRTTREAGETQPIA